MTDLAELGLRIHSEDAALAEKRLGDLTAAAGRAEGAEDKMANAARRANSSMVAMLASIEKSVRELVALTQAQNNLAGGVTNAATATQAARTANISYAYSFSTVAKSAKEASRAIDEAARARPVRPGGVAPVSHFDTMYDQSQRNFAGQYAAQLAAVSGAAGKAKAATGLLAHETLNLSRQFADVGVSLASGQALWMVAIQQGTQIGDTFQTAAMRGVGFRAVLGSIYGMLAPLLPALIVVGGAAALVASGFGLLHRELAKGYPDDITKGLGLTAEQLDRVKSKTVTFGDTVMATFTVIGRHIMAGPVGDALHWLEDTAGKVFDSITGFVFEASARQAGVLIGTYRTVTQQWGMLPRVFGEIMINVSNNVLTVLEAMINSAVRRLNAFAVVANLIPGVNIPKFSEVDIKPMRNEFAGAGAEAGKAWATNVLAAADEARKGMRAFGAEIGAEALRRARARATDEAGKPNKGRDSAGGQSDAEREYDRLIKAGEQYRDGLIKERAEIGMTTMERRAYEAAQIANRLETEGGTAASKALAAQIREEQKALEAATMAQAAAAEMRRQGQDRQMMELERDLIGATNVERARQIAMLAKEIELRNQLGAAFINTPEAQKVIAGAGDNAAFAAGNENALNAYNDQLAYQLDLLRQIDDQTRAAARGLADAFGEAGKALGDVLSTMTSYKVRLEEIDEAERRYRQSVGESGVEARRIAMFESERAQAQVQNYGDMAGAAKGFFKEGSDGYRFLAAIERAYRLEQLAMSLQAMLFGEKETAATVAQGLIKATAHGVVAVARAMASLPFPLNLAAGAATIAALAAIGVRLAGGGGSGGGGGGSGKKHEESVATAQTYAAQSDRAQAGSAAAMASVVEVKVTADREGLTAHVTGIVHKEAAPMVMQGTAAAIQTSRDDQRKAAMTQKYSLTRKGG